MFACVCVSAEYCACTGVQTRLPAAAMRIRTKSKTSNARIVPHTHSPPNEKEGKTESVLEKVHMRLKSIDIRSERRTGGKLFFALNEPR